MQTVGRVRAERAAGGLDWTRKGEKAIEFEPDWFSDRGDRPNGDERSNRRPHARRGDDARVIGGIAKPARVVILRMRHVPAIDATGMHALEQVLDAAGRTTAR